MQQLEVKSNKDVPWMEVNRGGGYWGWLTLSDRFLSASLSPGKECSWAAWRSWSAKLVIRG